MLLIIVLSVSANNLKTSLPVHLSVHTSLFIYYCLNVSSVQVQSANCKSNWSMSGYSKWYWPGVGVLARRIRLVLNRCWCKYVFMERGFNYCVITKWAKCLSCSYISTLVALSCPLNVKTLKRQNVTSTPPPASSNQLYKYSPECFSCPSIHMVSIFRFQSSKLYVGFRKFVFVF